MTPPTGNGDDTFHELGRQLPTIDVDATTAEQIARHVRHQVGKGPSPRRLVLPIVAGAGIGGYLGWTIAKLVEILS